MNRSGLVGHRSAGWIAGLAVIAIGSVLLAPPVRADDSATRAARLSYVNGQVRLTQGSQLLADPALVNTPLFEGTQVVTSEDGRAELEFDDGSVVRLSPNSSLTLSVLRGDGASGETEIDLAGGLGYFELQGGSAGNQIQVRFGDSAVTASGFAVLRIDLDNPPGELAVFSGNAHLERGRVMALDLRGGESATLNAADPTQYILAESIEPDSWDTWNSDRDQALSSLAAARTGAANSLPENNNPAWNDLDASGNWYSVPGTGSVWSPFEASNPGWDPYGNGYWMWTPRFGYIWVSGDSWGYMPFQCGAWNFYNDFGWGWAPGMCQPWWGGGGWLFNIGLAPGRYRPPARPTPLPPHSPIGRPPRGGFTTLPANAVVPVNRRPPSGTSGLPMQDRNAVVTIGGHTVEPLRPISPRPLYDRPSTGQTKPSRTTYPGGTAPAGQRPATASAPGGNHPPPARAPTANQSAPPPSHPSSGGGSGGGSHSSGGGGGNSENSGHR